MKTRIASFLVTLVAAIAPEGEAQWMITSGPAAGSVECLAIQDTNLFAGIAGGGIFRSSDLGASWTAVNNGLTDMSVWSLAIATLDSVHSTIFAATYGGGVFRSSDNGSNWTQIDSGLADPYVFSLAVSPNDSGGIDLFAGTEGGVLYRSTNGGNVWTEANPGITNASIRAICVVDSTLLIGTDGSGIIVASEHGSHWDSTGLSSGRVRAITSMGDTLFAGIYNAGVFISSDKGRTWNQVDTGLTETRVEALAVSGSNVFAGTYKGGVFRSNNKGENWTQINSGLSYLYVQCLTIWDTQLLAGVGGFVYRRPLSDFTPVEKTLFEVPREFSLSQNFPNPFNPTTTIRFSVPGRSRIHLTIYSLLGLPVAVLADEDFNAGKYERTWTANVSSGIYFCTLRAVSVSDPSKQHVDVKKLVLLK